MKHVGSSQSQFAEEFGVSLPSMGRVAGSTVFKRHLLSRFQVLWHIINDQNRQETMLLIGLVSPTD